MCINREPEFFHCKCHATWILLIKLPCFISIKIVLLSTFLKQLLVVSMRTLRATGHFFYITIHVHELEAKLQLDTVDFKIQCYGS